MTKLEFRNSLLRRELDNAFKNIERFSRMDSLDNRFYIFHNKRDDMSPLKNINKEIIIPISMDAAWAKWTTEEGLKSFFAPEANFEMKVGGKFEMLFMQDAPPGEQGSEGCKVLSFMKPHMVSFDWNAPVEFGPLRHERTWVVITLHEEKENETKVVLNHLGWQEGENWDKLYDYFTKAWDVVLERLQKSCV